MSYITSAQLKATLTINDTYADADIATAVVAASNALDLLCKRKGTATRGGFEQDADANQVRYYTPEDGYKLNIDDLVTFTSLQTDPGGDNTWPDTWVQNTDFDLEPLNAAADGWPYTRLHVRSSGSFVFPVGYSRSVKVTGKFGWPAVPEAVTQATTILASRLLKRAREVPFGVVAVNLDGAAVRIAKADPDVMLLLGPFIKHRISVA
jgi:hypothetical protein